MKVAEPGHPLKTKTMNLQDLCYNNQCPLKESCLRFLDERREWRNWHHFEPVNGRCEAFIRDKKENKEENSDA